MGRSYPADTRHQARPPPAGGGGATTPRRLEQPSQHRRSPAEPLLVSPLPLSRGPRSPFGSSALPTSSPAVLVSSIRPIERIDDHHPSTPRLTTPPVNPDASDAATNVAQPSPVSPLPSTCKSAASVIVPVPRLLSLDAQFPPPPARPPHKPVVRRPPSPPPVKTHPVAFRFEWSDNAARHNIAFLRQFRLDLAATIAAQPFSTITPGSEFRPATLLAPFLSRHPLWSRFRERITLGAEFPLTPIADTDRQTDLQAILSRGNHKSARGHETKLAVMLKEEVSRGWQLPLPKEAALELPECEVAPLGVVAQWTIDENGDRKPKLRLTHDQSFNPTRGERRSVNDRVITAELTPARFGRALMRLLHYICLLRRRLPGERLLLTKVDCKSAYRRIHLQATTAIKACTVFAGLLLVALRLTFGGAPNPSQWSDVSEVAVDLANDLVRRNDWDPTVWSAPQQYLLSSDKAVDCNTGTLRGDERFSKAAEMLVAYPVEDAKPMFECYLDDLFGVSREADRGPPRGGSAFHPPPDQPSGGGRNRGVAPKRRLDCDIQVSGRGEGLGIEGDPGVGNQHPKHGCLPPEGQAPSLDGGNSRSSDAPGPEGDS